MAEQRRGYFTRKSVHEVIASHADEGDGLKRALGWISLLALGVGGIIGAGIFVLTGTVAAKFAGPGVMLSFALSGLACTFVALCYAELAALAPVSGSAYTYTYLTLGEIFAWIVGWNLVLEYAAGAAIVAAGWSAYFNRVLQGFGVSLPAELTTPYFSDPSSGTQLHGIFNVPAAAVILVLTAILVRGAAESSLFNNAVVAIKVTVVLIVIFLGASHVDLANWTPLVPENAGEFGRFGWSGVMRGASIVFFAYIGFDAVSTASQEARLPQRDVPIAILGSLVVCTVLYIAVAAVATGVVPYKELGVPDPIALAIDRIGVSWVSWLVKLGALAGLTTAIHASLFGQTRVFYAMARDGLLPPVFARLHAHYRTPAVSQTLVGVMAALAAGLLPIEILDELVSIGTLAAFAFVCAALVHLRRAHPGLHRPFRAPASPWLPILGIACCVALMAALPIETWIRLVIWTGLGLGIYFGYGVKHARR